MHTRIKENRAKLNDELKNVSGEIRSRLDSLPKNRMSLNDKSMSKIILPRIHEKAASKFDNISNVSKVSHLPTLGSSNKSIQEMMPKDRYIKYKSLLKRNQVDTDRGYSHYDNRFNLQSSSSSQNMSVQEKMLDKVYGTIDQNKNYL